MAEYESYGGYRGAVLKADTVEIPSGCAGCGKPLIQRECKKPGANQGRLFMTCPGNPGCKPGTFVWCDGKPSNNPAHNQQRDRSPQRHPPPPTGPAMVASDPQVLGLLYQLVKGQAEILSSMEHVKAIAGGVLPSTPRSLAHPPAVVPGFGAGWNEPQ
jgi:hypothetical protein